MLRNLKVFSIAIGIIPWLLYGCAKRGLPSGGPPDETPPEVISTFPLADSTGIAPDSPIRIRFSEEMDRKSVESSIFVSPNPTGKSSFDWDGREVKVIPSGNLRPDRTYVVTIGTGAKDQHRNHLAQSHIFAFSTGDHLDYGEISGRVISDEGGLSGAYVWAYDLGRVKYPDPAQDSSDYATQATDDGRYKFLRLSPGSYRVFAFSDRDRDGRYTVGEDLLGVPSGDLSISESLNSATLGDLYLALRDTTGPNLLSAKALDNTHVNLRFSEEVDISAAKVLITHNLPIVERYRDPNDKAKIHLLTEEQRAGEKYLVTVAGIADRYGNPISDERDSASFLGSSRHDKVGPKVVSLSPPRGAENVRLEQPLKVVFNEAMERSALDREFWVQSDSTQTPAGSFFWESAITLVFSPSDGWQEGRSYLLQGDGSQLFDRAGNSLVETEQCSVSTVIWSFTAVERRAFGSFSGMIVDEAEGFDGPFRLKAEWIEGDGGEYQLTVQKEGEYVWDELLPGRYVVSVFRDDDKDGRMSLGRAFPFVPAEPTASYPDTVTVRSRWETKGIDIKFGR